MYIRSVKISDYYLVTPLLKNWWGGRQMAVMLPSYFLTILLIQVL